MGEGIRKQVLFVLEDDNEVMTAALEPGSDLDDENKKMNRELIKEHEKIIGIVERGEPLTQHDLDLIRDANEIHLNDVANVQGHYKQAVKLDEWLERRMKVSKEKGMVFDKEGKCKKCGSRVSFADVRDTIVYVGDEIVKRYNGDISNRNCVRCNYPNQYPDYEDYDKESN